MEKRRLFHYTTGECFINILADGQIKLATERITKDEKPVVWFSFNQDWEPTANKMTADITNTHFKTLTKEETARRGKGLIRIEIKSELAPYTWQDYKMANVPPKCYKVYIQQLSSNEQGQVTGGLVLIQSTKKIGLQSNYWITKRGGYLFQAPMIKANPFV